MDVVQTVGKYITEELKNKSGQWMFVGHHYGIDGIRSDVNENVPCLARDESIHVRDLSDVSPGTRVSMFDHETCVTNSNLTCISEFVAMSCISMTLFVSDCVSAVHLGPMCGLLRFNVLCQGALITTNCQDVSAY